MARRIAEACGADPAEVALCVSEATTNAVQHAYRLAPLDPGNLRVSAWPEPEHLVIEVRDSGMGMRPRPDSPGIGLGLPLIANIAMSVDICDADPGLPAAPLAPASLASTRCAPLARAYHPTPSVSCVGGWALGRIVTELWSLTSS
jgi:hypothetical protein